MKVFEKIQAMKESPETMKLFEKIKMFLEIMRHTKVDKRTDEKI